MSQILPPFLVKDCLLRLAIQVGPDQIGLHVHPGSTIPPLRLSPGWHYHWPVLSVLRVYDCQPATYIIALGQSSQRNFGDQPIVAVTQDHHLFTIEAELSLQLDPQINDQQLAKLDGKSTQRLIRPLIRQAVRQVVGLVPATDMTNTTTIQHQLIQAIKATVQPTGLLVQNVNITTIAPYHFGQKNQAQEYPGPDSYD